LKRCTPIYLPTAQINPRDLFPVIISLSVATMKEVHHAGHQTLDLQADYNKEKGKPNKSLEILVLTLQSIVLDTAYKNYTNGAQYKHHVVI